MEAISLDKAFISLDKVVAIILGITIRKEVIIQENLRKVAVILGKLEIIIKEIIIKEIIIIINMVLKMVI